MKKSIFRKLLLAIVLFLISDIVFSQGFVGIEVGIKNPFVHYIDEKILDNPFNISAYRLNNDICYKVIAEAHWSVSRNQIMRIKKSYEDKYDIKFHLHIYPFSRLSTDQIDTWSVEKNGIRYELIIRNTESISTFAEFIFTDIELENEAYKQGKHAIKDREFE